MSPTLVAIIKSLILPPGIILLIFMVCIYFYFKERRILIYALSAATFLLYLFSIPVFSRNLAAIVEPDYVLDLKQIDKQNVQAIVVLGCSRYPKAPEFNRRDTVSACTLIRLHYAVLLYKRLDLPMIVSGGSVYGEANSEAELMQSVLENEYNIKDVWKEPESRNTIENAKYVGELLKSKGIEEVILVTHAVHMSRAQFAFIQYDVAVIPAPTYFYYTKDSKADYFDYLPSIMAFHITNMTLYEIFGYLWAKIWFLYANN